ncbi:hypothetical protein RQP46_003787 [Phenoliferia psychrophenolica]
MTRASFTTLPLELKDKIVKMTSEQDEAWKERIEEAPEDSDHTNSLSEIALVNKELRVLAAKYQFKILTAHQASLPIFRYSILQSGGFGHCITEIQFIDTSLKEGYEPALLSVDRLPALHTLDFCAAPAKGLFGPRLTLDPHPTEDLRYFRTFEFIGIFSTTMKRLSLELLRHDPTLDPTSMAPARLPHLTHLSLLFNQHTDLTTDLRPFSMLNTLRHFSLHYHDIYVDPTDPALLSFLDSQPTLYRLQLEVFEVAYRSPLSIERHVLHPSSAVAYADVVRSRNLDPSDLDEPFHPDAILNYTDHEAEYLKEHLDRALEFGRTELERIGAEGNAAEAMEWIQTLKPLEDKRLRSRY